MVIAYAKKAMTLGSRKLASSTSNNYEVLEETDKSPLSISSQQQQQQQQPPLEGKFHLYFGGHCHRHCDDYHFVCLLI